MFQLVELREFIDHLVYEALFEQRPNSFPIQTKSSFLNSIVQKALSNEDFQSWFRGSRVVDPEGNPLLVFHGTTKDFQSFSQDKIDTSGTAISTNLLGFFFTNSADVASIYPAKRFNPEKGFQPNAHLKMFFLNIKKPFFISEKKYWNLSRMTKEEILTYQNQLKSKGFDGIIMPSVWRGQGKGYDFVVFDNNQVKPVSDVM